MNNIEEQDHDCRLPQGEACRGCEKVEELKAKQKLG